MSTRGTIVINNENGERGIAIYNHSDSYIHQGLGATLFEFLDQRDLVSGYSINPKRIQSNGLGCMAAQLVTLLKKSPTIYGGVYIMEEGEEIHGDVEYVYYITPVPSIKLPCPTCGHINTSESEWEIEVELDTQSIFTGNPREAMKHFGRNRNKPLFCDNKKNIYLS